MHHLASLLGDRERSAEILIDQKNCDLMPLQIDDDFFELFDDGRRQPSEGSSIRINPGLINERAAYGEYLPFATGQLPAAVVLTLRQMPK